MEKWLPKEDKLLKKKYPDSTPNELLKIFKGRTISSINRRSDRLNLYKSKDYLENKKNSSLKINKEVKEMKENPLRNYVGKDKMRGQPVRLNVQKLKADKTDYHHGRYASIIFWGDIHYGSRECDRQKAKAMLDYCLENKTYIFLMGDLLEAATRSSVGAGVYKQIAQPQEQLETMIEWLRPLAEKKLILGALMGNHEFRIEKDTGINVMKVLCAMLKIPYLGSACWNLWRVNGQSYKIYTLHGSTGSRFLHTKLKAITDISHSFNANLIVMGHVHELDDAAQIVQDINKSARTVTEKKKILVITGHYLKYDRSYAQEKGYPIGKMGSPKVKLYGDRYDIHVSI